jgi:Leucine-rich repeat (LRR) protein
MQNLTILDFRRNFFNSPIPSAFGQLSKLVFLDCSYNLLKGSVPDSFSQLTHLSSLHLSANDLSGVFPSSALGLLPNLTLLALSHNNLHGALTTAPGQFASLQILDLESNLLQEALPDTLCGLTQLSILWLGVNDLTGTAPACLGSMSALISLDIDTNQLHGTFPPSLGNLVQLESLYLNENHFTGTIPATLCSLSAMKSLYLDYNPITGSIPPCLGGLSHLQYLGLQNSKLTGTIPPALGLLTGMITMWFDRNYLTGTIPDFRVQQNLTEINVAYNLLTGTIPNSFGAILHMQIINCTSNYLTGPVPSSLGGCREAQLVALNDNLLSGSLPKALIGLHSVLQLYLDHNQLSGSLDGVFDASTQVAMLDVFLNDNQLTGTLPDELFLLPKLNTIVAQGNCFTGTLSAAMCESPAMVSLILDGLHTAQACRRELLSATHSYTTGRDVHGTIPACLLSMPYLVSLHLAGNGLSGTLPDVRNITAGLVDLTVSHNYLTGTIPTVIQAHSWHNLDVSFNRLTGTLKDSFGSLYTNSSETAGNLTYNSTAITLGLQNNRLSGRIPSSLVHLQNVSVLGSNMFACKIDKSDLPKHDGDRDNYQCGSDAFNEPFYVVLALIALASLFAALFFHQARVTGSVRRQLEVWKLDPESLTHNLHNLHNVLNMSDILCRIGLWCTALIVVVLVPWYAAASDQYSTFTHEYAWAVSAAFLSGLTPVVVEMVLYSAVICALVVIAARLILLASADQWNRHRSSTRLSRSTVEASAHERSPWQRAAVYTAFLVVNICVVVGVNAGFVAATLTQSNVVLVFAQVALSVFKLLWTTVCTPYLISQCTKYVSPSARRVSSSLTIVQVFLGLFNNIAIPCLVVAVLSPSCFYDVIDAAPPVTSTYFIEGCKAIALQSLCTELVPVFLTSTFRPPFRYDYQCSSSFITYYAPAFVYLGLTASVGTPLLSMAGLWLLRRSSPGSRLNAVLMRVVPRLLQLPGVQQGERCAADATLADAQQGTERPRTRFNARSHFVALITYLGILLTFGVVFPPLAVVMCATMLSVAWQTKLSIGRFLHFAREQSALQLAEAIDRDCKGAVSAELLHRGVFLIMCFACCFYALFLFDTLGDAVGLSGAYWVLIVMPLFPLAIIALWLMQRGGLVNGSALPAKDAPDTEVELGNPMGQSKVELSAAAVREANDVMSTMNVLQNYATKEVRGIC